MSTTSAISRWIQLILGHVRASDRKALVRAIKEAEQRVIELKEELEFMDRQP